jgi:hypothetical protein
MPLARTAGRKGRPWRRLAALVLAESDRCVWCWHGGSNAVNHRMPLSRFPHLAQDRANLDPIHGVEGCPECAPHPKTGRLRNCNTEVGPRILGVEAIPPGPRLPGTPAGAQDKGRTSRGGRTGRTHAGARRYTRRVTSRTVMQVRGSREW